MNNYLFLSLHPLLYEKAASSNWRSYALGQNETGIAVKCAICLTMQVIGSFQKRKLEGFSIFLMCEEPDTISYQPKA